MPIPLTVKGNEQTRIRLEDWTTRVFVFASRVKRSRFRPQLVVTRGIGQLTLSPVYHLH